MSTARIGPAALLLFALLGIAFSGPALEARLEQRRTSRELLYLPNGKYLKIASLGQAPLVADLIYLWAIQYYANLEQEDRFRYVEHVFGNVIAELDPHYVDPYWIGGLILTVEVKDLEAGLRLLDLGFERNPDRWILPYLAGWECYYAGRIELSADYFKRASEVPGAPAVVRRMRAGLLSRRSEPREALRLWVEVRDDPQSDVESVTVAKRQIRVLKRQADLGELQAAVDRFRNENGRNPRGLDELRLKSYIDRVPSDPSGRPYDYDPRTGKVARPSGRVLGGS